MGLGLGLDLLEEDLAKGLLNASVHVTASNLQCQSIISLHVHALCFCFGCFMRQALYVFVLAPVEALRYGARGVAPPVWDALFVVRIPPWEECRCKSKESG